MAYIKKRGTTWSAQISWYFNDKRQYKTKGGLLNVMRKNGLMKWK